MYIKYGMYNITIINAKQAKCLNNEKRQIKTINGTPEDGPDESRNASEY
jgi:hypothetical protein